MRKRMCMPGVVLVLGTLLTPPGWTQEKSKAPDETKSITPLKVQVVLSEFEGEKKISSLPYTFLVSADFVNDHAGRGRTSLRMGLRVPVTVSTKDSPAALQYIDVGTDLDCWAFTSEDGRFKLELVVERSSLYAAGPERKSVDWGPGDPPLSIQPIVRKFRVAFSLLVRDGQTVQSTAATDPITGRVQKVEVTATIAK